MADIPDEALREKRAHVRRAQQTRGHTCHWPGCSVQVPPAMWGCREHWFQLPQPIRDRIWRTYHAGQEEGEAPVTTAYLDAALEAQEWIRGRRG